MKLVDQIFAVHMICRLLMQYSLLGSVLLFIHRAKDMQESWNLLAATAFVLALLSQFRIQTKSRWIVSWSQQSCLPLCRYKISPLFSLLSYFTCSISESHVLMHGRILGLLMIQRFFGPTDTITRETGLGTLKSDFGWKTCRAMEGHGWQMNGSFERRIIMDLPIELVESWCVGVQHCIALFTSFTVIIWQEDPVLTVS